MKIQFESSTACNGNCIFCPHYKITRPKGEMSDELFHKIVREGKNFRRPFFVPFLNGEPFVFPRIWKWLDYMRDEGCLVHLYSNMQYLDVDRIVKYPNITVFCCDIDSTTDETHTAVKRIPDYGKIVEKTKKLIETAPRRMKVYVSMVVVERNKEEKEEFQRLWGDHAVFGEFKNWGGSMHDKLERNGERTPCWTALNTMNILWDGKVVACCLDYDGVLVLGDANKENLTKIWQKSKWFRDMQRSKNFEIEPCKNCNQNIL